MKIKCLQLIIMLSKWSLYGVAMQCLFISMLLASEGNAQKTKRMKDVYINVEFKTSSLVEAFEKIESETGFEFTYYKDDLPNTNITLKNSTRSLEETLFAIAGQAKLKFRRVDDNIWVDNHKSSKKNSSMRDLVQEDVEISGKVKGTDGQELPGVNVIEKGTANGVISDLDGNYSITVSSAESILVFTFVGMEAQEAPLSGRSTIDVTMTESATSLEEIMVVAYGTAKKSTFTGSAATMGSDEIEKIQVTSITQALQGNITGVQVNNTNGQPGSEPTIRVRGISSINGSSDPLIVVDGSPFGGSISSINPNDVESMSVLKDASATVLYGSRASGGVIVITTKKGRGEAKINYKTTIGSSSLAIPTHKRVNNAQYYETRWEALKNGQIDRDPSMSEAEAAQYATDNVLPKLGNYNAFESFPLDTNGKYNGATPRWTETWEDVLFGAGPRIEHHLDVSGGDENGNYFASFGYFKDNGTLTNADFKRYSGRVTVNRKVKDFVEVGLSTSFTNSIQTTPVGVRQYRFMLDMPDIYPAYEWDTSAEQYALDANGEKILDFGIGTNNGWRRKTWGNQNPLGEEKYNENLNETDNFGTRARLDFTIIPGLKVKNNVSVDYKNVANYVFWNGQNSWATGVGGRSTRMRNRTQVITLTNLVEYDKTFSEKHNVNILAGHEMYSMDFNLANITRDGFPIETLTEAGAASSLIGGESFGHEHKIESYLSRLEYNYDGKYFFSSSFRRDGTSRFGSDSRWGNFWSVGSSWIISKESFMSGNSLINNFVLRASHGLQGNERLSSNQLAQLYAHLGLYSTSTEQSNSAFLLSSLANPTLKWETNVQTNIGINAALLSNRVKLSVDYFIKKSNDLLFNRELALSAGLGSIAENVGDVKNSGIELTLNTTNINSGDLIWNTQLNFTKVKNEITSLPNETISTGNFRLEKGVSMFSYYIREWAGVDAANGDGLWFTEGGQTTNNVNDAVFGYHGSALPSFYGNITNNVYFKGFDFSFNLYFSVGGKVYDNGLARMSHPGSRNVAETFVLDFYENRWTPETPNSKHTRTTDYGTIGNTWRAASTRFLVSGSFARLRNVTLGYTIPTDLVSKIGLDNVRVFMQGDNMMTFFSEADRGFDPEMAFNGSSDIRSVPVSKIFTAGIQIAF